MTPNRNLVPALLALAFVSCASQKPDTYDTPDPYGVPDSGQVNAPANPVYDTPAAYEETGTTSPNAPVQPIPPYDPTPSVNAPRYPTTPATPTAPSNGAAIIHTVVKGDTLSGISSKYGVPSATIMKANNMTKDTVVLGRKMVIPAAR
jgi:LysM repeat protein